MRVFILATCRSPELLPYTLLVFDTIRTGFPTAHIIVQGNNLPDYAKDAVTEACLRTKCEWRECTLNWEATIHHKWVEYLCDQMMEPFVICDTDMVFFQSVEDWKFNTALAGWRIPEWEDEFTKCCTRARLHTSLLFIDPVKLRDEVEKYKAQFPVTPFNPIANLFYPLCVPYKSHTYFSDTCSLLYHAIGGTAFSDEQLNSYFHFSFGSIPDVVLPTLSNGYEMGLERDRILKNPALGYGRWREAMEYFAARQKQPNPPIPLPEIKPEDVVKAREWNIALTKGNQEAMSFNDLVYSYFHLTDDMIDESEDGRSKMNAEQKLELLALAAAVYNSPFYVKNRELLFPLFLQITNMFCDSVQFERSPLKHRRMIANVLSSCGDELYAMVAMICGGWSHMRSISGKLRERDWLSQHDENGERR